LYLALVESWSSATPGRTPLARSRYWLAAASVGEELVNRRGRRLPRSGRRQQDYLCGVAAGAVAKFWSFPPISIGADCGRAVNSAFFFRSVRGLCMGRTFSSADGVLCLENW
jgi:hypothetical protein